MNAEPVILHGVVRHGAVLLDEDVKLPDGTPVTVHVRAEDLPPTLRARLTGDDAGDDASAVPGIDQWEREE